MAPLRRADSWHRPITRPIGGWVCPYRRCRGRRYERHNHLDRHILLEHSHESISAPEYRAPSPEQDPLSPAESSDDEQDPIMPFWDWGPSQRHAKSIALISDHDLRRLGCGESLLLQVHQLLQHIESVSKPILEQIDADDAPEWEELQKFQAAWAHLKQGAKQEVHCTSVYHQFTSVYISLHQFK